MNLFIKHTFMMLLAALLASGCAQSPSSSDANLSGIDRDQAFDRNQDRISNLESWHFEGRFSVRTHNKADSASLSWLQQHNDYLLKLSGPLNQGTIFLRGNPSSISYKDSKGIVDTAKSPEELLSRHTDYELPISSLRYWVLGRPDPHFAYDLNISPNGDLRSLKQQGWHIQYEAFATHDRYRLPGKIVLKHPDVTITLSIHEWNAHLSGH